MGLTKSERAVHYSVDYIEFQISESERMQANARKRLNFWKSMLEAKKQETR